MPQNAQKIKQQIKDNIGILLNKNNLEKAKELLEEYSKMVSNDIDTYSIKAVIAMIEQRFDDGENIIKEGLIIEKDNYDLLYNLGYLYEIQGKLELSKEYYKKAKKSTVDRELKKEAQQALEELRQKDSLEHQCHESNKRQTSIVILTYNNLEYNKLCIESIRKYTEINTYEIIVVDNNSTDGTVEWLKEQKDLKVIFNKENLGFPKGCNQGIEVAKENNDILLLNNDTIVTSNWLNNLQACLYSEDNIGAVGAITNSCSNFQAIHVPYKTIEEMQVFAKKYNVKDPSKWEERLRLVGYCMLIKNEVVNQIGLLDEIFTPGNFEDDDYSLRIRQAGYRIVLCKDTFIHHFGSASFGKEKKKYSDLLNTNRKKFYKKWGFDPYAIIDIRKDITKLIKENNSEAPTILQIGCSGGGTLLDIKNEIPSAELYGIEFNKEVAANTKHFANIRLGSLDSIKEYQTKYFDYIILTISQSTLNMLQKNLKTIKNYLKAEGTIITVLSSKLNVNNETFNNELKEVFDINFQRSRNDMLLNLRLKKEIRSIENKQQVKQTTRNIDAKFLLRRIENNIQYEENLSNLINRLTNKDLKVTDIVKGITNDMIKKDMLFNCIALECYSNKLIEETMEILMEAYKFNPNNKDTAYNLSYITFLLGDKETALTLLDNICEKDDEIVKLKQQIMEEIK